MNSKKFKSILLILFPLGIVINNIIALYKAISLRRFNDDELQHTHIAWNIFQGKLPYADFFEHHGPLFGILNGFIFSLLKQVASFDSLILLRKISLVATCLIGLVLFFIALETTKSKRIASLTIAIFFMWDTVQRSAFEIRPDILQTLFWLLGFYLLIRFYKYDKPLTVAICGLFFGIMLCFNFKTAIAFFTIIAFLLVEFFRSKSKIIIQNLFYILLSASIPVLVIALYFYSKGALSDFLYYTTLFNVQITSCFNNFQIAQRMHQHAFFEFDAVLTFFFLYGLQCIRCKSRYFQLMLVCIFIGIYSIIVLKVLYTHNYMIYLPFCSIIAAVGLDRLILRKFYSRRFFSFQIMALLITLWVCVGTPMHNLLEQPELAEERFISTKNNINQILNHTNRQQATVSLWNDCGGYIFNADPQFYWTDIPYLGNIIGYDPRGENLIALLENQQIPVISAYERQIVELPKATRAYILSHYRLMPINPAENCIWARIIQ